MFYIEAEAKPEQKDLLHHLVKNNYHKPITK
jgi:hypothetical protein